MKEIELSQVSMSSSTSAEQDEHILIEDDRLVKEDKEANEVGGGSSSGGVVRVRKALGCAAAWLREQTKKKQVILAAISIALMTDMLVYGVVFPILPDYAMKRLGIDSTQIGILFGGYSIGMIFATPIFGVISDNLKMRKVPMLISLFGLTASTVVFGLSATYFELMLARMAQGVAAAGSWVIGLAMVADVYPVEEHGTAMGIVQSMNSLGLLIGPPLGGVLYDKKGFSVPFIFCSVLAIVDFVLQLIVVPNDKEMKLSKEQRSINSDPALPVKDGTKHNLLTLVKHWQVASALVLVVLYSAVFAGIEPILPIYLAEKYHIDATRVGLLYFVIVVAYIVFAVVSGKLADKFGTEIVMNISSVAMIFSTPLMSLPDNMVWQIVTFAVFGTTVAFVSTPLMAHLSIFVEKHANGEAFAQVYSLYLIAYSVGMMIGPVFGGLIMDKVGFFWSTIFFSGLMALYFPIAYSFVFFDAIKKLFRTCWSLCHKETESIDTILALPTADSSTSIVSQIPPKPVENC